MLKMLNSFGLFLRNLFLLPFRIKVKEERIKRRAISKINLPIIVGFLIILLAVSGVFAFQELMQNNHSKTPSVKDSKYEEPEPKPEPSPPPNEEPEPEQEVPPSPPPREPEQEPQPRVQPSPTPEPELSPREQAELKDKAYYLWTYLMGREPDEATLEWLTKKFEEGWSEADFYKFLRQLPGFEKRFPGIQEDESPLLYLENRRRFDQAFARVCGRPATAEDFLRWRSGVHLLDLCN